MKMHKFKFTSHSLNHLGSKMWSETYDPLPFSKTKSYFALIWNFEWKLGGWFNASQNCLLLKIWSLFGQSCWVWWRMQTWCYSHIYFIFCWSHMDQTKLMSYKMYMYFLRNLYEMISFIQIFYCFCLLIILLKIVPFSFFTVHVKIDWLQV